MSYEASESLTYGIGSHECAADILSTLEDLFYTHVGSVADGCENLPHDASFAFCRGTFRMYAKHNISSPVCTVGRSEPASIQKSANVFAQDSVGRPPHSKGEPRRRAVSSKYPEVSTPPRFGRELSTLQHTTVPPQQTHLLNETVSYLRRHGNPMPEVPNFFEVEMKLSSSPHFNLITSTFCK